MFPYFEQYPGFARAARIVDWANLDKASFGKGAARGPVGLGGFRVDAHHAGNAEKMSRQRANSFRTVAPPPARLFAESQTHFGLARAIIDVEVSNGADRRVILILDDVPELPSIAPHVVPFKDGQKFGDAL